VKYPILFYVVIGSSFLAAVVGLVRYRKLDIGAKALATLCMVNFFEGTAALVLSLMKIQNLELLNDYRPVELALTAGVFYLMVDSRIARRLLVLCASAFILVWIVDKIYLDDPGQLNNRMAMLSRILAAIMSIVALYFGAKGSESLFFERPLFWVGTAVLVYSSGTLVVLGLSNELINLKLETFMKAWQINWTLLIMANLFYTKGLLCKPQRPT
jgi:hypothetical protein